MSLIFYLININGAVVDIFFWFCILNGAGLIAGSIILTLLDKLYLGIGRISYEKKYIKKTRSLDFYNSERINLIVSDKHYFCIRLILVIVSNVAVLILPISLSSIYLIICISILLLLAIIDINHCILPDALTQALLWMSLLWSVTSCSDSTESTVISIVLGYTLFWLLRNAGRAVYGQEVVGGGDLKLVAALAGCLSWYLLPYLLLIACVITLVLVPYFNKKNFNQRYPFGPGLAIAGIVILFWKIHVEQSSGIHLPCWLTNPGMVL